jgi:hypothetical protein
MVNTRVAPLHILSIPPKGIRLNRPRQQPAVQSQLRQGLHSQAGETWWSQHLTNSVDVSSAMELGIMLELVLHSEQRSCQVCPSRKKSNVDLWELTWILDDTFSLKSRKGLCTFKDDTLSCGPNVKVPSEFSVCCEGFLFVSSVLFTNCSTWNRPKMESSPIREILPSSPTSLRRAKCRARFTLPGKNTPRSLKSPGNPSRRGSHFYSFLQHWGPCSAPRIVSPTFSS